VQTSTATAGRADFFAIAAELLSVAVLLRFKLLPPGGTTMPSKPRKPKPFKASTAVKAAAREKIGAPPPTRTEPSVKRRTAKSPKHKPTLDKMLNEDE
jgi:hypothetical protein